jgi:hypothetical protein
MKMKKPSKKSAGLHTRCIGGELSPKEQQFDDLLAKHLGGERSPEEQKFAEVLGRYFDGERSPEVRKFGELLTRCPGGERSPERRKFGELLVRYLDGTLSPEDLGTFQKQLREDPKRMTEFAETLVLDVQLRDIMKEKKRKILPAKPGGKSSSL